MDGEKLSVPVRLIGTQEYSEKLSSCQILGKKNEHILNDKGWCLKNQNIFNLIYANRKVRKLGLPDK